MFVQNLWASKCKNGMKNKILKNLKNSKGNCRGSKLIGSKSSLYHRKALPM
jgi:hypothetical protein